MEVPLQRGGAAPSTDSESGFAQRSQSLRGALRRYFAKQVRDPGEIDDLVQEVFLRIVKRGGAAQIERLDGYIFQTASSVLKDRVRRRKSHASDSHVSFETELHEQPTAGPEQVFLDRETLRKVSVALLELPERTRRVFVLRRLEGMSHPEVGAHLGISVSAVEKHMGKAIRHLLARMGEKA